MYKFLDRHRLLRGVLDWIVIIVVAFTIFSMFQGIDLDTAWFVPIYINLFAISMFCYVDYCHEPPENRMGLVQWLDNIRWINGIGLILHTTIGYYRRNPHIVVVDPIWGENINIIVITISIYLLLIIVPSIIIHFMKKA